MIAKITRGSDMGGLVRYLMGRGRSNEHTDQRVIAVGEGIAVPIGVHVNEDARRLLVDQLDGPRRVFGVDVGGGHVWHLSLTNAVGDRSLSDDEWSAAVRRTLAAVGFVDDPGRPPTPWVAIRHGESSAGNEHVHVAVSLVREDGTKASIWNDRRKVSTVCRELETEHNLKVVAGRSAGALPGITRAEQERAARRTQGAERQPPTPGAPHQPARGRRPSHNDPDRYRLERMVRAAAAASRDEGEFVRRLRADGTKVRPRYDTGTAERVVGYSVSVSDTADGSPLWFGGGKLARDLTLPTLRAGWEPVEDQRAAWTGTLAGRRREDAPVAPAAWRDSATRVRAAREALGGVPLDDRAQWARVARDSAGAFAALAHRLGDEAPPDLLRLADTLARSAQVVDHRPARTSQLEGIATVAAQAALGSQGGRAGIASWALLAVELLALAEAIRDAHEARHELARAQELNAATAAATLDLRRASSTLTAEPARGGFSRPEGLER